MITKLCSKFLYIMIRPTVIIIDVHTPFLNNTHRTNARLIHKFLVIEITEKNQLQQ